MDDETLCECGHRAFDHHDTERYCRVGTCMCREFAEWDGTDEFEEIG